MDLKAYQAQIKELIPLRNEQDFNELLNKILFGENNSDKFLIKMELNRLAKPCQRILDIRDKITDTCIPFEQDKLKHYLTKETIKVLQDSIELYGVYTIGAFEAVHEYIVDKKNKKNIQQNLIKPRIIKEEQCELLALSQKNKRGAARMFFVSDVTIITESGERLKAQTSNMSLTGLKLRLLDDVYISNGTKLSVMFVGLSLEYNDKILKGPISYQLVKQQDGGDNSRFFYLNYIDAKNKFTNFIGEFIRLNQYKYKIDVHYYYQIAKTLALKNSYLAQMNILPIYLDMKAINPFLFSLKNKMNQQVLNEWRSDGIDQLPILFEELRFVKLIAQMKEKQSTTIYTCTHTEKSKQHFLCASEEELVGKGLKQTFINYGRGKSTWRVYHLTLVPFQYKSPKSVDITELVPDLFKRVTHSATLQRLTKAYPFTINKKLTSNDVNQLTQFVHRNPNNIEPALSFTLTSDEQRKEERYLYQSKLSISDNENSYNGHIIDFSYSGLKVKLEHISSFSTSSILTVNLKELQKVSVKYPLSKLKYKVVGTGPNNILHLQVCDRKTLDICHKFFSILVKNNAKHFTCMPLKDKKQPSTKHLVKVAEESFINAVFFVSKLSARPKITFSAIDVSKHPLHKLFSLNSDDENELNYYPIANNQLYERLVIQPFKESENSTLEKEALIYIKVTKDSEQQWIINSFLDADFDTEKAKIDFIKESQFNATFYALHYRLTPLSKITLESIKTETRAISRFAAHLTKKLEEELSAIEAMIEITDRTAYIINSVDF
jgi:hypothetical protein